MTDALLPFLTGAAFGGFLTAWGFAIAAVREHKAGRK